MVAKIPALVVVPEEVVEDEQEKCPPVGAPAWMATFADIAILLMAFFVLILSFAEFNQPRFRMVAGSLQEAFGIQREVPVVEQPRGTTVLSLEFSPSPEPSLLEERTQDSSETELPELETDQPGTEGSGTPGESEMEELMETLQEAIANGDVSVDMRGGSVVIDMPEPSAQQTLAEQLQQVADGVQQVQDDTGTDLSDIEISGLTPQLPELAALIERAEGSGGNSTADGSNGVAERDAAIAEAELSVALHREIAQGLVQVEREEDRVFITVGAGGAFPSGEADLTQEARDIMARIAFSAMGEASQIQVTGHTDDVPVDPNTQFRDNWGLGAARAASVVRELGQSGLIEASRLTAVSRGESQPIATNTTSEGREQNRRIEIDIQY